jgi:hypothetical protein
MRLPLGSRLLLCLWIAPANPAQGPGPDIRASDGQTGGHPPQTKTGFAVLFYKRLDWENWKTRRLRRLTFAGGVAMPGRLRSEPDWAPLDNSVLALRARVRTMSIDAAIGTNLSSTVTM